MYKILFKIAPVETTLIILTTFISATLPTLNSLYFGKFLDEIIAIPQQNLGSILDLNMSTPIIKILVIITTINLITRLSRKTHDYLDDKIQRYNLDIFESQYYKHIAALDVQQFEDPEVSNAIRKGTDHFYKIYMFFGRSINLLTRLISTLVSGYVSFTRSPIIAVTIIALSLPQSITNRAFIKKLWAFYNDTIEKRRKQYWVSSNLTSERAIPQHKITQSDKFIFNLYSSIKIQLLQTILNMINARFIQSVLSTLVKSVTYIITPLYLLDKIIRGDLTLGQFTFFEQKFIDFSWEIDSLLADIVASTDAATYISYTRRLFEIKPVLISGSQKIKQNSPPLIEFRNVSFKYPKSKQYALKNINLTIEPGQEIAIVGKNGAGKTTLIKLLLRFYDPDKGTILINRVPLQNVDLRSYYKLLSALFQEYNQYGELSVKENIYMGKTTQKMDMNKIKKAAKLADADKFINNLDNGYNQILNKRFSNGTNLSTGEWQKIALARMFYRDTSVLILDEPTASIDAVAEYKIFKRIYSFIKNKTVIIISHRFSTVRNAKKIYVLDKGNLVESGTHDHLLKQKGKYAKAFKLQAEGYQNE